MNRKKLCRWQQDDDGAWQATCGNAYGIIEGTPEENGMKFCCFCGGSFQRKRSKQESRVEELKAIYALEIGQSIFIAGDEREQKCIRSGFTDPCRKAYRGLGAYETKSTKAGIKIWRVK